MRPRALFFGPVVELAYTSDLKSDARTGLAGSSPAGATRILSKEQNYEQYASFRKRQVLHEDYDRLGNRHCNFRSARVIKWN